MNTLKELFIVLVSSREFRRVFFATALSTCHTWDDGQRATLEIMRLVALFQAEDKLLFWATVAQLFWDIVLTAYATWMAIRHLGELRDAFKQHAD
jgi:hypothetical protein